MTLARRRLAILLAAMGVTLAGPAQAAGDLLLGATTSTENSGLLDHLLPRFTAASGIEVRVIVAGTGAILKLAERGDIDVLLTHAPADEQAFVAAGFGIDRREVMTNDFVLVGPRDDPARIADAAGAVDALARIAAAQAPFVSRGDQSGTHRAEQRLWRATGLDPAAASGRWYRETGAGQGATLNVASNLSAYALADRATWMSFGNRRDHVLLVEDDPALANVYAVTRIDPARFPGIETAHALAFQDWITSPEGARAIAGFTLDGEQVFIPAAAGS